MHQKTKTIKRVKMLAKEEGLQTPSGWARVTWSSNPCNLKNKGKNSAPPQTVEKPLETKIVLQTTWSFVLVLLFSFGPLET